MFLLLTIFISLALSGLTFLINDKKASLPEGFDSYNLDGSKLSNASDVNAKIGAAGGPVKSIEPPVNREPSVKRDVSIIRSVPFERQYTTVPKPVPVIAASSASRQTPNTTADKPVSTTTMFDRIFDFMGKPEAFSLKN